MSEDPGALVSVLESSDRLRSAEDLVTDPREGQRNGVIVGSDGPLAPADFPDEFADDVTVRTRADQFAEAEDGVTERVPYDAAPGEVVVEERGGGHPDGYDDPEMPYDRSYTVEGPEQRLARLVEVEAIEAIELTRPQPSRDEIEADDEGNAIE